MDGMEILGNKQGQGSVSSHSSGPSATQGVRADRLGWIKELVRAEQRMEESGVIEFGPAFDPAQILVTESARAFSPSGPQWRPVAAPFRVTSARRTCSLPDGEPSET